MPYIGLIPFLHNTMKLVNVANEVSMPYIGLIPFLLDSVQIETIHSRLCQCPTSGLSHFYKIKYIEKIC